jgi:hypothetical protein
MPPVGCLPVRLCATARPFTRPALCHTGLPFTRPAPCHRPAVYGEHPAEPRRLVSPVRTCRLRGHAAPSTRIRRVRGRLPREPAFCVVLPSRTRRLQGGVPCESALGTVPRADLPPALPCLAREFRPYGPAASGSPPARAMLIAGGPPPAPPSYARPGTTPASAQPAPALPVPALPASAWPVRASRASVLLALRLYHAPAVKPHPGRDRREQGIVSRAYGLRRTATDRALLVGRRTGAVAGPWRRVLGSRAPTPA